MSKGKWKRKYSDDSLRYIQNFGEQHPDFKEAHKEAKRVHPEWYK